LQPNGTLKKTVVTKGIREAVGEVSNCVGHSCKGRLLCERKKETARCQRISDKRNPRKTSVDGDKFSKGRVRISSGAKANIPPAFAKKMLSAKSTKNPQKKEMEFSHSGLGGGGTVDAKGNIKHSESN